MSLDRYLARSRIGDLTSKSLAGALAELAGRLPSEICPPESQASLVRTLLEQENSISSCLGQGVCLPHARLPMKRSCLIAIGRALGGLEHNGLKEYRDVRLVFLLVASPEEKNYLGILAALARLFSDKTLVDRLVQSPDLATFQERLLLAFGGKSVLPEQRQHRFNLRLIRSAVQLAKSSKSAAILFFSDTFVGGLEADEYLPDFRTIMVTRAAAKRFQEGRHVSTTIEVRSHSRQRLSQLRSAILIGLTSGIFKFTDRLCCVGGIPSSNHLDTILLVDIQREFQGVITREGNLLPPGVKIEVVERVVAIATDLSLEGREGKPVGALFVLGDAEKVNSLVKQLVLNPFYGYSEEERHVLNPFMDETIKEFSVIDGCFVIRGDGVIESAGSLIHTPVEFYQSMPSGLGSRHAAAAAISLAANCLAIVVSASSGQVSLFRRGVLMPLLENPIGGKF